MAKSTKTKKAPAKTPVAFATKEMDPVKPSADNSSRYQPTDDAVMDTQALDELDGMLKLLTDSVKDIYWAENHLLKSLPKMIKAADDAELKNALNDHLKVTENHVVRLQQVFDLLGKKPQGKKCDAMEGLTKEGEGVIEDTDSGTRARHLGIIMAAQKVEHYEISAYNGLQKLAGKLGLQDVSQLFGETLQEEQQADETLAGVAENIPGGEVNA